MGITTPSFTGGGRITEYLKHKAESRTECLVSTGFRAPPHHRVAQLYGKERGRQPERHVGTCHSNSQAQAGRPWGWELQAAGKDMMTQYSPSARVSWMATDWSMPAPAERTHPGEGQKGGFLGQHVTRDVMELPLRTTGREDGLCWRRPHPLPPSPPLPSFPSGGKCNLLCRPLS